MSFFADHYGRDRAQSRQHIDNRHYQSCFDFCERWDQASFDPDYAMDLQESFAEDVRQVFARKAWDPSVLQAGKVGGLLTAA